MTLWNLRGLILVGWIALPAIAGIANAQPVSPPPVSPGQAALNAAAKDQKYLFVLFWNQEDMNTRVAWQTLQGAVAKHERQAKAMQVNITNPAEKGLVERYGVSRSPMPLVLAVAPNGAITGGFPLKLHFRSSLSIKATS